MAPWGLHLRLAAGPGWLPHPGHPTPARGPSASARLPVRASSLHPPRPTRQGSAVSTLGQRFLFLETKYLIFPLNRVNTISSKREPEGQAEESRPRRSREPTSGPDAWSAWPGQRVSTTSLTFRCSGRSPLLKSVPQLGPTGWTTSSSKMPGGPPSGAATPGVFAGAELGRASSASAAD